MVMMKLRPGLKYYFSEEHKEQNNPDQLIRIASARDIMEIKCFSEEEANALISVEHWVVRFKDVYNPDELSLDIMRTESILDRLDDFGSVNIWEVSYES